RKVQTQSEKRIAISLTYCFLNIICHHRSCLVAAWCSTSPISMAIFVRVMRQPARTLLSLIFVVGYCCMAGLALANNIAARSGTAEDIQIAVAAARPGDTIIIPEGRFAFHGQTFLPDGLALRGAGCDMTWLIKDDRLGEWKPMFSVDCKTGKPFHFS